MEQGTQTNIGQGKPHFRQAVQVGNDITGIMKLPCVTECRKRDMYRHRHVIEYYYTLDPFKMALKGWQFAHVGEWLCEDSDGKWHLLTDDAYQEYLKEDDA